LLGLKKSVPLFIFTLVLSGLLEAQGVYNYFNTLLPANGLSQSTNEFFYRDKRGFLWVSSMDGLNRFDGISVRVYRFKNRNIGNNIQSEFFEDGSGNLWFSVYEAVACYDRRSDSLKYYQYENIHEDYYVVFLDRQKGLWVRLGGASNGNMYRMDIEKKEWSSIYPMNKYRIVADTNSRGAVNRFYAFSKGEKGLVIARHSPSGQWEQRDYFTANFSVKSVLPQTNNLIWLGTNKGLVSTNPDDPAGTLHYFTLPDTSGVSSVCFDGPGHLLLASDKNKIWQFDVRKKTYLLLASGADAHSGLLRKGVRKIGKDADDNIWMVHPETGLSFTNKNAPKSLALNLSGFAAKNNKSFTYITGIVEDHAGAIYVGTSGAGIIQINGTKPERILPVDGFAKKQNISALFCDKKDNLWVGCNNKVFVRLSGKHHFLPVPLPVPRAGFMINQFLQNSKNQVLVASDSGIWMVQQRSPQQYGLSRANDFQELDKTYVPWFYQDKQGNFYFDNNYAKLTTFKQGQGKQDVVLGHILAASEDSKEDSIIWLATDRGLYRFNKDNLQPKMVNDSNVLPSQFFFSVIQDKKNYLWLSSNKGVVRYDPVHKEVLHLTASDGIWEDQFYANAWLKTKDNRIILGNKDVLNIIQPDHINFLSIQPKIEITGIALNDERYPSNLNVGLMDTLTVPYHSTLKFDFVALDFSDPDQVKLRFRLEGYDPSSTWIKVAPGNSGNARYPKLSSGNYIFQIQAANSDGKWSENPKNVVVIVPPPFWEIWWFRMLSVIVIIGVIFLLFRWQVQKERKKQQAAVQKAEQAREKAQLEAEKSELERKNIEMNLQTFRLQMNPHFIFNSLNSINYYILKNESENASNYLDGFAQLMRWTLERSDIKSVSLHEELAMLEKFIALEARRLMYPLHWEVNIAPDTNPYSIDIPALILQPFVENAVWHGLLPKQGEGRLVINLTFDDPILTCIITDDGVGRMSAKQRNPTGHVSKSETITKKRLEMHDLKYDQNGASFLDIQDLNGDGKPTGTKVMLKIFIPDG